MQPVWLVGMVRNFSEEGYVWRGEFCVVVEGLCVVLEEACVQWRGAVWHSEEGHVVRGLCDS
ncbi:hypothetical protein [Bartonella schoenbuchensis]|uniref:hypothetical protein n=1 Tax=Bartonella schoenbuchensis TaxID=165694 RepID=UPI0012946A62|nr:hypothetical protein [Bartonella schoenbuchensis]